MGHDLMNDVEVFVPANAVFHPYEPRAVLSCSAATPTALPPENTIEEAILHGLLEVIERDALSIAEYTRNPGREIALSESDG